MGRRTLNADEFENHVRAAIDSIPEGLRTRLENVEIVIADWPTNEELASAGTPHGYTLFGLYSGVPLVDRTSGYHMVLPDRITIFRGPLEEAYQEPGELQEEIRSTVIHEFAHHFGLSDDDLQRLGGT